MTIFTDTDLGPIVARLEAIYRRVRELEAVAAPASDDAEDVVIEATPYVWRDASEIPTRLAGVGDAVSGLRYSTWCIGETLMAVGGLRLMNMVFTAFEGRASADEGTRPASWLDHRWDGIMVGDEAWVA